MRGLWNELLRAFASPAPYVAWAAISVMLALAGPFGTYAAMPPGDRVLYFAAVVGICLAWGVAARTAVQSLFPRVGFWGSSCLVVGLASVALARPLHGLAEAMARAGAVVPPKQAEIVGLIVIFGLAVALTRWAMTAELQSVAVAEEGPPAGPRLMERLDPDKRGALIRISGRDHYVDVVTDKGLSTLLLRLSDALAEVVGADGLQVHRSHWVAVSAVVGAEKSRHRHELVLSDGSRVPVSRNFTAALQSRGLL